MNALIALLLDFSETSLFAGFFVFLRVGAVMAVLPAFGEQIVPARIRLVLALIFTLIVSAAVAEKLPVLEQGFGIWLISEIAVGLALGLVLRFLVLALQTAGSIAAQSTSLSQIFGGAGEPAPAMGHLLLWSGLALAVMSGLHVKAAGYLILSYDILPAGQMPDASALSEWGVFHLSQSFALAFTLSAPFLIASLIYNFALGVINRAMPQLMVTFVGAPAITAGGMLLLMVAAPLLLGVWSSALSDYIASPYEMR